MTSNLNITIMPKPLQESFEALLFLVVTLNLDTCCRIVSTRGILKKEGLKFQHGTCKTSDAILLRHKCWRSSQGVVVFFLTPPEISDRFDIPDLTVYFCSY